MQHFEDLWEHGESLSSDESSSSELVSELEIKILILKNIINSNLSGKERAEGISIAYGAILKSLTFISKKENVNVFVSLKNSLEGEEGL